MINFNTVAFNIEPNDSNQELIIIDGQQRLTTTLILLITLRNRMRNPDEANRYIKNDRDEYRLIPSYLDRPAFYSMIDNNDAQCAINFFEKKITILQIINAKNYEN